ncbi:cyclase family protein [Ruegeria sediminis]|uniref:Cyclase family protein n=1 Tax=Ruegeria sediminis TaxID=2583820 RepID=A0ABY2WV95_9RHOB|nr:cyclase family protein [Ruegeria sediminis]TMV05694.1 cyclase family protein [Ruegeria sediminis]
MARRYIDLSVPLETGIASDPPIVLPEIEYLSHQQTAGQIMSFFPGLKREDLPGGEGWAIERLKISTHNGTHVDAPYHYHSTMNKGERAMTIDEVPLEWCFGSGVKFDFRHMPDGHVVTPKEIEVELARIGHDLRPLDIVVVNTSAGAHYGLDDYLLKGCGFGRDATNYLTGQGVRMVGTDAWSWDAPFAHTAQEFARTGDPSIIWEGHRAGMDQGYCQIEKMTNLDLLPDTGFIVSAFPFKIKAASAGFTRAVAIIEG